VVINFGEDQMTLRQLKERERKAYIEGDTELAKILGMLIEHYRRWGIESD
jgi:hypothetical protein